MRSKWNITCTDSEYVCFLPKKYNKPGNKHIGLLFDSIKAIEMGPIEILPDFLKYSSERNPKPPVFYYGFKVTTKWAIDFSEANNLNCWAISPRDGRKFFSTYYALSAIPDFLQEKSGIKSYKVFMREMYDYNREEVDEGTIGPYVITISTNYESPTGMDPTESDIDKLREALGRDPSEKPIWYIGRLPTERVWDETRKSCILRNHLDP